MIVFMQFTLTLPLNRIITLPLSFILYLSCYLFAIAPEEGKAKLVSQGRAGSYSSTLQDWGWASSSLRSR